MANRKLIIAFLLFSFMMIVKVNAQKDNIDYFLPVGNYNNDIKTPTEYFGLRIGEWHISHDQMLMYMSYLDGVSERIKMEEYGRTAEKRPLIYLAITSQKNHQNINNIRSEHLERIKNGNSQRNKDIPGILYQGYSIHGNEASGINAAIIVAYYLAACNDNYIQELLSKSIILIDPCLNPDGVQRFSTWVNSHRSENLVSDPNSREFNEVWPGGRYNHYWFDLNRDWLPLVHPESKARISLFNKWRPHLLTDHHEMGTNSTFFFQPGIPSRNNPNTPSDNFVLTEKLAKFHANALDSIGSLYFTKANFDDFYYGKGSTYPEARGCVGILFEQASSRGHIQESVNGPLTFAFTIRNQVVTSLSSQKGFLNLRQQFIDYQASFRGTSHSQLNKLSFKGWIFTDQSQWKLNDFISLLLAHEIEVFENENDLIINGKKYEGGKSYIVPIVQSESILAKTFFEKVRNFEDSTFYDISSWTPSLAYDLQHDEITQIPSSIKKKINVPISEPSGLINMTDQVYAYICPITGNNMHRLLYHLLKNQIRVKFIHQQLKINHSGKSMTYDPGSIIIPSSGQLISEKLLQQKMDSIAKLTSSEIYTLTSGNGVDKYTLGHPDIDVLKLPAIAMLAGDGIEPSSAGEIWHHLDQNLAIPLSILDINKFRNIALEKYNVIILASGQYQRLSESDAKKIEEWTKKGNTLILIDEAITWGIRNNMLTLKEKKSDTQNPKIAYHSISNSRGSKVLAGSIFKIGIDPSHPLFYGHQTNHTYVMHSGTRFYEKTNQALATPASYTKDFITSGYIPKGLEKDVADAPAITIHRLENGRIIAFQDDPLFRGFWKAGYYMFNNALFFGHTIKTESMEK